MNKKHLSLIILALVSVANVAIYAPAAEAGGVSGCALIDHSWLDGIYSGYHSWHSLRFYAGDTIVINAQWPYTLPLPGGAPVPSKGEPFLVLEVNDTIVDTAPLSGQLRYVFEENAVTTVYWHNMEGVELIWDVNCHNS